MPPGDFIRVLHMRDAALEALSFTQGKNREDLDHDRKIVLALVKEVRHLNPSTGSSSSSSKDVFTVNVLG